MLYNVLLNGFACYHSLSGRLEETEEELVQLKIEREAERQRRAKYGTANGSAVEAVNSTEPPSETGDDGGETWGVWEPGEPTSEAPPGEQTTSQGSKWHCLYYSVLCKRNYAHVPMHAKPINVVACLHVHASTVDKVMFVFHTCTVCIHCTCSCFS